ncbi:MAG TPA: hypothetical protein DD490_10430 [Acidobacteria bacterium]|nr:hypothetical protein [Acidobacteriota bacterium]
MGIHSRPGPAGVLVAFGLAGLAAALAAGFWGFSYDDAFITYRYAKNWADGAGLVYNPGEHVLGTTAPGYALLLGVLSALSGLSVPAWGTLLAIASLAAAGWVLWSALAAAPPVVRTALPLLFVTSALLFRWNVEMFGAEAFPVVALGVAAAHLALDRRRPVAAGLLAAAAMICRLDAGLLAALLGLELWRERRRFPWAFALAGLLPLALFLGWLQADFGAVVPETMAAKQLRLPLPAGGDISYNLRAWRWLWRSAPGAAGIVLLGLALWSLAEGAYAALRRRSVPAGRLAAVTALWLLAHEITYRLLGIPFAPWYHLSLANGLLAAAAAGAVLITRRLLGRPGAAWAPAAAAILFLPLLVPSITWVTRQWGRPPDPRWAGYVEAARIVRQTGGSVAAVEIGFLGYFSEAPVLDLMGLVSPEAREARRSGTLADLVARKRPDYLLDATLFRGQILAPLLADPRIATSYREVAEIPDGRGAGQRIRLLSRGGRPPGRGR